MTLVSCFRFLALFLGEPTAVIRFRVQSPQPSCPFWIWMKWYPQRAHGIPRDARSRPSYYGLAVVHSLIASSLAETRALVFERQDTVYVVSLTKALSLWFAVFIFLGGCFYVLIRSFIFWGSRTADASVIMCKQ